MKLRAICILRASSTCAPCATTTRCVLCLAPVPNYSSAKIRALRARHKLSQAVFASVLNTSLSAVRQWEIGDKQPSGPSLKLLNLLDKKGLEVLI